ncbi:MAG: helix-turn-helix transcriptional regulator [Eubacterium sp.]|nr:helix-turn-helix transcriptional regulator [Eubacterium sp.]
MTKLSDRLLYLRKREGYTQDDVAKRLGLSRSAVSMYEIGQREPDLETLEMFADLYNVNMDVLGSGYTTGRQRVISDSDLMFALWGGSEGIDAADLQKVREYAAFIKSQKGVNK